MEKTERQEAKGVKQKSAARGERGEDEIVRSAGGREEVDALKKRIVRLEAENKQLRKQIAALSDSRSRSSQPGSDSVREQQHNFFKYGNVRRY
jgi:cell division protein FtsB